MPFGFDDINGFTDEYRLHFIGTKDELDLLMESTVGTSIVRGNAAKLYSTLAIKKAVDPDYVDVQLPDYCALQQRLDHLEKELLKKAYRSCDADSVHREDVLGDDVGKVRSVTKSPGDQDIGECSSVSGKARKQSPEKMQKAKSNAGQGSIIGVKRMCS